MTGIKARRLRHRVELWQNTEAQDPKDGAIVLTPVKYGERWAEYVANSVRDLIAAGANQSEVKGRFVLRHDAGINGQMWIVHRGKRHDIVGEPMPDPDSGLEYITCAVTEGVIVV